MLSKHSPPPRFFIVAEENQQRLAFSDTIRSWGFEIVECLAASQLTEKHFQQKVDVWLVDTQDDYAIIQNVEKQLNVNLTCLLYTSPSPRDQRGSRMPSSA